CKLTPFDHDWPSTQAWAALNASIGGALLETSPVASSCYPGNPFRSSLACSVVSTGWNSTDFHASLPESISFPIFANNSCLPPGSPGFFSDRGCMVGGLPQYIVNATSEQQVATAMRWASHRNIRIIVKGTGHDLMGRSSGAFSLSIWTHQFINLVFGFPPSLAWHDLCEHALVVGSGALWRDVYAAAEQAGRAVVGGTDGSVGLGGHVQGGGHGPLSSTYGLAADQLLQATVVTSDGQILRVNEREHADLLWAVRGGSAGLYGVVTEFVLRTYPAVSSVAMGSLAVDSDDADASWTAAALVVRKIPQLMDAGFAGAVYIASGLIALALDPALTSPPTGVIVRYRPFAFNTTPSALDAMLAPLITELSNLSTSLTVTAASPVQYPSFMSWHTAYFQTSPAGGAGLISSRLLPRSSLAVSAHELRVAMAPQNTVVGAELVLTMTAGRGPARVPQRMRGALNPAWRGAYVHAIASTAFLNSSDESKSPQTALRETSDWLEAHTERSLREWAPRSGAYFNEANGYDPFWKENFYGEHYERLVGIKRKYDPSASLWVLGGIGNEEWGYDLQSGKLCR
ncbi:FAD-binding domain-containing protein, partial [Auricularia subglabra TFB-10046 SS5]